MSADGTYIVRQTGRWRFVVERRGTIRVPNMSLTPPAGRPKPLPLLPMTWEVGTARTQRGVRRLIARDERDRARRANWASQTREIPTKTPAPSPDST
jgi:hypothetical protein